MKFTYFIGMGCPASTSQKIAASAVRFDVCLCPEKEPDKFVHGKFANSAAAAQQPVVGNYSLGSKGTGCPAQNSFGSVFLCHGTHRMVHPRVMLGQPRCFLQDQGLAFALYSPLHLKRSLGLARGKNDRRFPAGIDAQRIAHYAGHPMPSCIVTTYLLFNYLLPAC